MNTRADAQSLMFVQFRVGSICPMVGCMHNRTVTPKISCRTAGACAKRPLSDMTSGAYNGKKSLVKTLIIRMHHGHGHGHGVFILATSSKGK